MDGGRRPNPRRNARLLFSLLDRDGEGRIHDLVEAFDTLRREGSISPDLDMMLTLVIREVIDVCGDLDEFTEEEFVEAARGCQCLWVPSPEPQEKFHCRFRPRIHITEAFEDRLRTDKLRRWCHRNDIKEAAREEEMQECTFWPETTLRPSYLPRKKFVGSFQRLTEPRKAYKNKYPDLEPTGLRLATSTHERFAEMLRTQKTKPTTPIVGVTNGAVAAESVPGTLFSGPMYTCLVSNCPIRDTSSLLHFEFTDWDFD
ncbi:hypothetical protein FOZ60_006113 [Perkinsus olseni]|uniref:Uncharacterized protein n=1 Tax=Perkinsus olseni TaxID=32597 RepID=A0A7J6PHM6_PEROL|nr:hypothetical protein FOZ60_006113 [Perkinsus olseni]